jgi:hypothetical protein
MVIEIGGDEKSSIILGRPFLNTAGAIMYANTAKICFNFKGKERHSSSRTECCSSLHTLNIPMSQRRRTI